jgi:shikimate kinase
MILSITGFMGCGKSSVGRRLSELLCCPFMDLDEMIEAEAGKSIPEIFAEVGESGFRQMELRVLDRAVPMPMYSGGPLPQQSCGPLPLRGGAKMPPTYNRHTSLTDQYLEIISLGGGTIMTRECAQIVRERTLCVYLRASVQTLTEHLEGETQGRPMLSGNVHERISELMAQRAATYESTAHVIIDIDGKSVDEVAHAIIDSLSRR